MQSSSELMAAILAEPPPTDHPMETDPILDFWIERLTEIWNDHDHVTIERTMGNSYARTRTGVKKAACEYGRPLSYRFMGPNRLTAVYAMAKVLNALYKDDEEILCTSACQTPGNARLQHLFSYGDALTMITVAEEDMNITVTVDLLRLNQIVTIPRTGDL